MVNWTDIHKDFAKKDWIGKTYQQKWEENNLTYQDAQEWIQAGFKPADYDEVKKWNNLNFTSQQAQSWIDIGLDKKHSIEFATYLRSKNLYPGSDLNLEKLREEFINNWKDNPSAQVYLDLHYPLKQRKEITNLYIASIKLQGPLDLSDFINLRELNCRDNKLTSLDLSNCSQLERIDCLRNQLTNLDLSNCSKLKKIWCSFNWDIYLIIII